MAQLEDFSGTAIRQYPFRAMNTNIELTLGGTEQANAHLVKFAIQWFRNIEERFSRFIPKSELSHLNLLAGERCMVSDAMLEVVNLTEMYWQITNGMFDPLLSNSEKRIIIDNSMKSIQLPNQTEMDLGGIVKSWAVQCLASHYQKKLNVSKGIINAGGDLTVWNHSEENARPWIIGIENPWHATAEIGQLKLSNGSVATSRKLGRQWENDRGKKPSDNDVVQCTVAGNNIIDCEIWAMVICTMGCTEGIQFLNEKTDNYEALIFTSQQETHFYGNKASCHERWLELVIDHYHS
jgi:FAD:protein FMN transferase